MMKLNTSPLYFCLILFGAAACSGEQAASDLPELDLMQYGMPIAIKAPIEPVVESSKIGIYRVISVKKGKDYYVEIYESDAIERDKAKIKSRLLSDVQEHPYFSKIVEDREDGFIFETAVDSTYNNFGFRYFRVQGDKEYVYQTGIGGRFTKDQVGQMFDAVSSAE